LTLDRRSSPALTDLLGGQTDFMFATPQAVLGMLQAGKLRALAVTSAQRVNAFPNVPTVAEQGYPGGQHPLRVRASPYR
jgi:tripartite-type tricarboxylate transporter receptor subunit TctC